MRTAGSMQGQQGTGQNTRTNRSPAFNSCFAGTVVSNPPVAGIQCAYKHALLNDVVRTYTVPAARYFKSAQCTLTAGSGCVSAVPSAPIHPLKGSGCSSVEGTPM